MPATDYEVAVSERVVKVRDVGGPSGMPVLYFHGTPGSRVDVVFGDDLATQAEVRIVSFDRPGLGGSSASSFSLTSVARDAIAIADHLGLEEFATLGLSGGGPFALAMAVVAADRVWTIPRSTWCCSQMTQTGRPLPLPRAS